jgi:hypothetical protein
MKQFLFSFIICVTILLGSIAFTTVAATNSVGKGSVSKVSSAVTIAAVPEQPTSVSATGGNAQVSVSFTAPSNGGSPITNYEYKLNSGSWISAATTSSPIVITGLTNYASYSIAIRAVNAIGAGAEAAVATLTYVCPLPISGNCPSGIAWSTVATGTSLPIRSSGVQNGFPGAVAFYDIATGKLSIDPKGWTISLFNFSYTWGSVNVGTDCTLATGKGPLVFVDGYGSGLNSCKTCTLSSSLCNVSGSTGAANVKNLPAGTWTLLTTSRTRMAGTVSLVRVPTLATTGDPANIGSATGWFDKYWSFGNVIHSDSIANIKMENWKTFGVSGNANANILGYGNYMCTFQYTVDGVVGNMVGAVIPYNSASANNAPTNIAITSSSIDENVSGNTTVGTLSTTDSDAGNTFTYTLVAGTGDTDNASFNISGANLRITASPNFETKNSYSVRIRTTDQGSLNFEKVFTITINNINEAPTLTTEAVSSIGTITATGNGTITVLGDPNPTAYGVCWNTTGTPTITNSKVDNGTATAVGAFTAAMTDLNANTTYYVRAYATNGVDTSYGNEVTFSTTLVAGIVENKNSQITVYPNPATDAFHIVGLSNVVTITLTDISGRKVLQQQVTDKVAVRINTLPKGIYILKIKNSEGIVERKVVKN